MRNIYVKLFFELGPVVQEMMFRRFHIESSRSPLVRRSGTIFAIREESIIWNTPAYIFNLDQLPFKVKVVWTG